MKRLYHNCMFYTQTWFLISCLRFTAWSFMRDIIYCLNYSCHHKGVMLSALQYLYICSFYLFLCSSFYMILHVLYDSWVSYDLFVSIKLLLLLLIYKNHMLLFINGISPFNSVMQYSTSCFSILKPTQNWRHFEDAFANIVFLYESYVFLTQISLIFLPKGGINNVVELVETCLRMNKDVMV